MAHVEDDGEDASVEESSSEDETDSSSGDDSESDDESGPRSNNNLVLCKRIDAVLALYYESCGRGDYFNDDEDGKFELFCEYESLDDDDILNVLTRDADNDVLADFGDDFPFIKAHSDQSDEQEARKQILKHCLKYGQPPALPSECISDSQQMSECATVRCVCV